jgi:hypothetical protein
MINIQYNHPDIRVETSEVSKILSLPLKCSIISHVNKKEIWRCELNDNSWATYANDSIFDIRIQDKFGNTILYREYNVLEDGSELDKSLYLYCKGLKNPKGVAIGTHDGEFGEWVSAVLDNTTKAKLIEASNNQYLALMNNYNNKENVELVNSLITIDGGDIEFFEGGKGYTNSVKSNIIESWECEPISSRISPSIPINEVLDKKYDWLHLDIEGYDAEIIRAINVDVLPNFIIFEHNNLKIEEKSEIEDYLINLGYSINKNDNVSWLATKQK